jgi:hypothetical protein
VSRNVPYETNRGRRLLRRVVKGLTGAPSASRAVFFVGLLAFVGSAAVGFFRGIPVPESHDEFSYLLAADTFARGRLTNPTHPMWVHFETMHVIHEPSYMSKYMPAQGMFLMVGRRVGGHPIVGVWLSVSLMCAAVCWMLQAWLPPRWALLGGLLAIFHPNIGIGNYWAQSYWGGAVPAAGGALFLGGVRRLARRPHSGYAAAAGLGLALLANSRPYEGLVLSLPFGAGLLIWLWHKRPLPLATLGRRVILPLAVFGIITIGFMGYYNYRITGSALRIPYLVHAQAYMMSTLFVWQSLPPKPNFRHSIIEEFHAKFELPYYFAKRSAWGFIEVNFLALLRHIVVVGNVLAIPLIVSAAGILAWCWKNYWGRMALLTYGFFILGIMLEVYSLPHYWAPVTGLSYFFVLQGIRIWRVRDPRIGRLVVASVCMLVLIVFTVTTYLLVATSDDFTAARQRAGLLIRLNDDRDRHLILVNYGPRHSYFKEWVYNEADIDDSKVVWARDMGEAKNCGLVEYFKDRRIWSLEINDDEAPIRLDPYNKRNCAG